MISFSVMKDTPIIVYVGPTGELQDAHPASHTYTTHDNLFFAEDVVCDPTGRLGDPDDRRVQRYADEYFYGFRKQIDGQFWFMLVNHNDVIVR